MPQRLPSTEQQQTTLPSLLILALACLLCAGCSSKQEPVPERVHAMPTVVSLAPSLTEMLYAIGAGAQLVGRTSACDYPSEVRDIAVAGAFARPSLEMLAAIHPDLVVSADLADEGMEAKIKELGIRHESIECKSPDEIPSALRKLGKLTGHEREADSLAQRIAAGLGHYRKEAKAITEKPSVYLEIWNDPYWTCGRESYTSALIGYAGGSNIGDSVEKEYFEISEEWVIDRDPMVIACMYMSKKASVAEKIRQRPGWQGISAVRNGRIYDNFQNSIFLRPGPRVLEGIAMLRSKLFPEKTGGQ